MKETQSFYSELLCFLFSYSGSWSDPYASHPPHAGRPSKINVTSVPGATVCGFTRHAMPVSSKAPLLQPPACLKAPQTCYT